MSEDFDEIDVKFYEKDGKGKAYVGNLENPDAEMVFYMKDDDIMVVEHTEVKEKMRGRGVARLLLDVVVDVARDRHWKIIPVCAYTKSVFEKDPAIRDVLYP